MTTTVVNLRREAYDVYIGRPGKGLSGPFGNPYRVEEWGNRALELFQGAFDFLVGEEPYLTCDWGFCNENAVGIRFGKEWLPVCRHHVQGGPEPLGVRWDPGYRARVLALKGKRLGCCCKKADGTGACHGDIIAKWLDAQP